MASDEIRYDLLVQDALRSVVRRVMGDASRNGLPGDHHFYITFRTGARGARISPRIRERFPEEMTIVLQHQFWDLAVSEVAFEVVLMFSGVSEKLVIPFDSIVRFSDPSVEFNVEFAMQEPPREAGANDTVPTRRSGKPTGKAAPRAAEKSPRGAGSEPIEITPAEAPKPTLAVAHSKAEKPTDAEGDKGGDGSDKVVSIDAFRKKP